MTIYWRKIYTRLEARDEGAVKRSIILYQKLGVLFHIEDRGNHPEGQFHRYPVGWQHRLQIDLWLCELYFEWHSGARSDGTGDNKMI